MPRFASGWNFGPADVDAKPVSWIADKLAATGGKQASWAQDCATHPREAHALKLDVQGGRLLGLASSVPLTLALEWTVEWYRAF